jgi:hypothetical protein
MVLNDTFRQQNLGHHKNLIFGVISNNPGVTTKEIVKLTGFSYQSISKHLTKMLAHKVITTTPAPDIIGTIMIGEGEKPPSGGRPITRYYANQLPENNELTEAQSRRYQKERNLHLEALAGRKSRVGLSPEEWLCMEDGLVVRKHLNISTGELTSEPLTNYNKSTTYGIKGKAIMAEAPTKRPITTEQIYAANYNKDGTLIQREKPKHHHKTNCYCDVCRLQEPVDDFGVAPDGYWRLSSDEFQEVKRRETSEYRLLVLPFKTCAVPKDSHLISHDELWIDREWLLGGKHSQALLDYLRPNEQQVVN